MATEPAKGRFRKMKRQHINLVFISTAITKRLKDDVEHFRLNFNKIYVKC